MALYRFASQTGSASMGVWALLGNPTLLQVSRGTRACAVKPPNSCAAVLPDCARLRSTTLPSRDGMTFLEHLLNVVLFWLR